MGKSNCKIHIWQDFLKSFIYLFERDVGEEQRERESPRQTPHWVQSPMRGLIPQLMRSWPELKSHVRHVTNLATQAPLTEFFFFNPDYVENSQVIPRQTSQLKMAKDLNDKFIKNRGGQNEWRLSKGTNFLLKGKSWMGM